MKKFLCVSFVIALICSLCACGGDLPAVVSPEEDAMVAQAPAPDVATDSSEGEGGDDYEQESGGGTGYVENPVIDMYEGQWLAYDRFSQERIDNVIITIEDITETSVIFSYYSHGELTSNLTATLDGNGYASVYVDEYTTLNMTFTGTQIQVDEIQGMGAMSYVFSPAV